MLRVRYTHMNTLLETQTKTEAKTRRDALAGCLVGGAIGDAWGLPFEGLSPRRRAAFFGDVTLRYSFLGNRGMVSDDTEHAALTARALCKSGGDPDRFSGYLAGFLRGWILLLPAGVGFATLRACIRLLVGVSPERSGVFSAGNGPAMRAAVIGAAWGHEPEKMRRLVRVASRITHTDPKAEWGALLVARAAFCAGKKAPFPLDDALAALPKEAGELCDLVRTAYASAARGESTNDFARSIGVGLRGVSGYIYQSVPVALHAAWRFPHDFEAAVSGTIACGGDTDTTAAIVGGIVGAGVGRARLPAPLLENLAEWPQNVGWLDDLSDGLARSIKTGEAQSAPALNGLGRVFRNLLFLLIVLAHGFRRLLPPY